MSEYYDCQVCLERERYLAAQKKYNKKRKLKSQHDEMLRMLEKDEKKWDLAMGLLGALVVGGLMKLRREP